MCPLGTFTHIWSRAQCFFEQWRQITIVWRDVWFSWKDLMTSDMLRPHFVASLLDHGATCATMIASRRFKTLQVKMIMQTWCKMYCITWWYLMPEIACNFDSYTKLLNASTITPTTTLENLPLLAAFSFYSDIAWTAVILCPNRHTSRNHQFFSAPFCARNGHERGKAWVCAGS